MVVYDGHNGILRTTYNFYEDDSLVEINRIDCQRHPEFMFHIFDELQQELMGNLTVKFDCCILLTAGFLLELLADADNVVNLVFMDCEMDYDFFEAVIRLFVQSSALLVLMWDVNYDYIFMEKPKTPCRVIYTLEKDPAKLQNVIIRVESDAKKVTCLSFMVVDALLCFVQFVENFIDTGINRLTILDESVDLRLCVYDIYCIVMRTNPSIVSLGIRNLVCLCHKEKYIDDPANAAVFDYLMTRIRRNVKRSAQRKFCAALFASSLQLWFAEIHFGLIFKKPCPIPPVSEKPELKHEIESANIILKVIEIRGPYIILHHGFKPAASRYIDIGGRGWSHRDIIAY